MDASLDISHRLGAADRLCRRFSRLVSAGAAPWHVLATSVIGSIAEHVLNGGGLLAASARMAVGPVAQPQTGPARQLGLPRLPPSLRDLIALSLPPADRKVSQLLAPVPAVNPSAATGTVPDDPAAS
jgi:hypothetical protein